MDLESSFNRGHGPGIVIAEGAATKQREENFVGTCIDRVDHRRGKCRFVRGIQDQSGEVGPSRFRLTAIGNGQRGAVGLADVVAGTGERDVRLPLKAGPCVWSSPGFSETN